MEVEVTPSTLQAGNLKAFSSALLALLMISAFLENVFLITTIVSSSNLRRSIFPLALLNLSIINVLEVCNMVFSLLYVAKGLEDWTFGTFTCGFNTAFSLLLGLETIYGIAFMSTDRAISLLARSKYERRMTRTRTLVAMGGLWVVGLSLTFPLLLGSVPTTVFPARYFCSVAPGSPLGYSVVLVVMHALAFVVLLLAFGMILHTAHKLRVQKRIMLSDQIAEYTDRISDYRNFLDQLDTGKFCVATFCAFFILTGPYMFMNFIHQIRNSNTVLNNYNQIKMSIPNGAEIAITWLKFLFPVVFPFFVFGYCRDIWRKFKGLVCCRKTNMVSVSVNRDILPAAGRDLTAQERMGVGEGGTVPTLVATSAGLHMRKSVLDERGQCREDYSFADIEHVNRGGGARNGTSDYDSEESASWGEAKPPHTEIVGDVQKTQLEVVLAPRSLDEEDEDLVGESKSQKSAPTTLAGQGRQSVETWASNSHVRIESAENVLRDNHKRSQSEIITSGNAIHTHPLQTQRSNSDSGVLQILVEATVHNRPGTADSDSRRSNGHLESQKQKLSYSAGNKSRTNPNQEPAEDEEWPDFQRKKEWNLNRQSEVETEDFFSVNPNPESAKSGTTTSSHDSYNLKRSPRRKTREKPMSLIGNERRITSHSSNSTSGMSGGGNSGKKTTPKGRTSSNHQVPLTGHANPADIRDGVSQRTQGLLHEEWSKRTAPESTPSGVPPGEKFTKRAKIPVTRVTEKVNVHTDLGAGAPSDTEHTNTQTKTRNKKMAAEKARMNGIYKQFSKDSSAEEDGRSAGGSKLVHKMRRNSPSKDGTKLPLINSN